MAVRILLADDHKILREGLRTLLEKARNFEIVGEAENGREAVRLVGQLQPEVVIMDISMPELNGIEATQQIIDQHPTLKIIVLSMHSDRRLVERVLQAGAMGYVLKDSAYDELVEAVQRVLKNGIYLSPPIVRTVVDGIRLSHASAGDPLADFLSAREREVLQLLAEGQTTKQIAGKLGVSVKTVETHRLQLKKKLKIDSIAELTKYAVREGLTSLD